MGTLVGIELIPEATDMQEQLVNHYIKGTGKILFGLVVPTLSFQPVGFKYVTKKIKEL